MTNKIGLIIVALSTFCLTSTLFMMRSTLSNPGLGEYDPWIDNNEDGTVDILDAIGLSNVFDTSGDPTKNVNVTNWSNEPNYAVRLVDLNCSWEAYCWSQPFPWMGYTETPPIYVGGFSRLYVYLYPLTPFSGTNESYSVTHSVYLQWVMGECRVYESPNGPCYQYNYSVYDGTPYPDYPTVVELTDTKAPLLKLFVSSGSNDMAGWMMVRICVYLRGE